MCGQLAEERMDSVNVYAAVCFTLVSSAPRATVPSFAEFAICLILSSVRPARREAQVICLGLTEMTAFKLF